MLKTEDFAKRLSFCNANKGRRANTWVKKPHAIIDNKKFPMYLQLKDRQYAARRAVRGAYRTGGQAVEGHLVKPKATLKYPVTGVVISAGINDSSTDACGSGMSLKDVGTPRRQLRCTWLLQKSSRRFIPH